MRTETYEMDDRTEGVIADLQSLFGTRGVGPTIKSCIALSLVLKDASKDGIVEVRDLNTSGSIRIKVR